MKTSQTLKPRIWRIIYKSNDKTYENYNSEIEL